MKKTTDKNNKKHPLTGGSKGTLFKHHEKIKMPTHGRPKCWTEDDDDDLEEELEKRKQK